MAVVHVSTWNDFKSAIGVAGDTVIVDSDIDANGSYVTSSIPVSCADIQGGGHTIYNIYANTNIFVGVSNIRHVVQDINFANIDTSSASSGGAIFRGTGTGTTYIDVYRCNVQGNLKIVASGYTTFTSCAIVLGGGTVRSQFSNMAAAGPHFTNCYIDIGDYYQQSSNAFTTYTYFKNCYITGSWKLTQGAYFLGNSTPELSPNNVVNLHLSADNTFTLTFFSQAGGTGISIYNVDRVDNSVRIVGGRNCLFGLSDDHMRDPAAIAATGFPIIT